RAGGDGAEDDARGCRPAQVERYQGVQLGKSDGMSNIIWSIVIGFCAGIIARLLAPGPNNPQGFILTTLLGIAGAFVATMLGQTVGCYRMGDGGGVIGAVIAPRMRLFIRDR